jgi:hypothetical protein
VRLHFTLRDLPGSVQVAVKPNRDPEALGCASHAVGFPVCTATVAYAGAGYAAMFAWIQLVRSSDGEHVEKFQLDPFEPLGALPHPFCWFGLEPTLFDAPSRAARDHMDWTAHSFLCFIAGDARRPEARAVLGFSWGFSIRDGTIALQQPTLLPPAAWNDHIALLRRDHPAWEFSADYRDR